MKRGRGPSLLREAMASLLRGAMATPLREAVASLFREAMATLLRGAVAGQPVDSGRPMQAGRKPASMGHRFEQTGEEIAVAPARRGASNRFGL